MTELYTGPTTEDLDCIPAELTARPQWVLWRGADRLDQHTGEVTGLDKIPLDPQTLRNASTIDPQTWGTFERCVAALPLALEEWEQGNPSAYRGGGIGYVFSRDDPYCGIDLDHCVDLEAPTIADWAERYVDEVLQSYAEFSPSGTGLHIFVKGTLPPGGRKKGPLEMYEAGRFFTMTGWHVPDTPRTIEARQAALHTLHAEVFGAASRPQPPHQHGPAPRSVSAPQLDDAALLGKARAAKNGTKFTALWAGDTSEHNDDDSSADMALCTILAFWTQDPAQLDRLFRQSGLMRDKWDEKRGDQTYGERTIAETLARQSEHYTLARAPGAPNGTRPADTTQKAGSVDGRLPWSDYTNALALVRAHGQDLRYCWPWRAWLVWTGTHWQRDDNGTVRQQAKQTVKRLARHAAELDDAEAKALLGHVKKSLSIAAIKAMVESAQDEPGIPVQPEDLDADRWLLNCANGTLDLQAGTLQPHARAGLLTRCIPVAFDPEAPCPTWERFLWRIMGGTNREADTEDMGAGELEQRQAADERARRLITFLQRAIGYSLTGDTREQCLFVLHGSGSNGKTTCLEALQALLGDYAQSTPSASLLAKDPHRHEGIPNDIARLRGARLVTAVEIGEGKRLNEELVKRLTGQDTMTARFLHAEFFDFRAEFKLFVGCNHLPTIQGADHALWRRIRLIPFAVTIPDEEQDKALPAKLREELPGILRWAVRGCLDWQREGLGMPEEVRAATAGYRASMDVLGRFIEECCLVSPHVRAKANALYEAYKQWCQATGEPIATLSAFGNALEQRGFARHKVGTIWRLGIGLPETTEEVTRDTRDT